MASKLLSTASLSSRLSPVSPLSILRHFSAMSIRPNAAPKTIVPPASAKSLLSPTLPLVSSAVPNSRPLSHNDLLAEERMDKMHRWGKPISKRPPKKNPLGVQGSPYARGVVIKTLIKKPKKPNSANRKCVLVRLSTGKEKTAYIPGEGHNLQEHSVVLCRVGNLRDVPGVGLTCVRGAYDLAHEQKQKK